MKFKTVPTQAERDALEAARKVRAIASAKRNRETNAAVNAILASAMRGLPVRHQAELVKLGLFGKVSR